MVTTAPAHTEADLCFLLSQASHALLTEQTAALAQLGISPRAHCVLSRAMAGGLTQTQLAELCALDKTTMVVTMDELEQAGLAERRSSVTDRRARIIEVTDAGERAEAEGRKIIERVHADVLGVLSEHERRAFVDALTHLVGDRLSHPVQCEKPVRRRVPRAT